MKLTKGSDWPHLVNPLEVIRKPRYLRRAPERGLRSDALSRSRLSS